jgi:hypothetical protein
VLKRGSWSWSALLGLALLALGAFIAFDVMDLDGSQLGGQPAEGAITDGSVDVARLGAPQWLLDGPGSAYRTPFLLVATAATLGILTAATRHIAFVARPRARLEARASRVRSSAFDPASPLPSAALDPVPAQS